MDTIFTKLKKLLEENKKEFSTSYQKFLYIKGYIDGIKSQKENDWCHLTEEDIKILMDESAK